MTTRKRRHGLQRIQTDLIPKLQALHQQGMSCAAIARAIGVGYATAYRAIHGIGSYAPKASA